MHRVRSAFDAILAVYRRSRLTVRGLIALAGAVVTVGGALLVLAVTSEDVVRHNGMSSEDQSWLQSVVSHRTAWLVDLARSMTNVGAAGVLAVLAVVAAVLLWWRGARVVMAIAPGVALGAAGICAALAKQLVDRSRPPLGLHLVNETEASFPSGHTTDSTAFFVALAIVLAVVVRRSPRVRAMTIAGAVLLAGAIGASRLELGVHWPTDVLAGWSLGLAIAVVVATAAVFIARPTTPPPTSEHRRLNRLVRVLSAQRASIKAARIAAGMSAAAA